MDSDVHVGKCAASSEDATRDHIRAFKGQGWMNPGLVEIAASLQIECRFLKCYDFQELCKTTLTKLGMGTTRISPCCLEKRCIGPDVPSWY